MIKRIIIKNFMGYSDFKSHEFTNINLLIGKNDTGKTGFLKLLYASCKAIDIYSRRSQNGDIAFKRILAEKLTDTFQPGKKGLGELVNKSSRGKLQVDIEFRHQKLAYEDRLHYGFGETTTTTINECQEDIKPINEQFRCLFIPAKEVLSSLKAIRATRDNLHIPGFDDTYLDLIRSLVIPIQRGNITDELKSVNRELEDLFEGRIEQNTDDDFILKKGNTEFPIQLTAEGLKKIGILTTLIRNRQLNAHSVLFIDEPETTLHPEATRALVKMLYSMAEAGIQIFLASHSFFVLKELYLLARKNQMNISCYNLNRERGQSVKYNYYNLLDTFPENAITAETLKMADEELDLDLGLN